MSGRAAASDSHFSRAVGFLKFLEIIDKQWQEDALSDDEVTSFDFWSTLCSSQSLESTQQYKLQFLNEYAM